MAKPASKKASFKQALVPLVIAFSGLMFFRWILFEPYTIPSGSMLPSLLLHDYISVNKLVFGLRLPFSNIWLIRWGHLQAGDVVVFRSPTDEGLYFVKRVVGIGGDKIGWTRDGRIQRNGEWIQAPSADMATLKYGHPSGENLPPQTAEGTYQLVSQKLGKTDFLAWLRVGTETSDNEIIASAEVPVGQFFVIGDNRGNSFDSRFFGAIPEEQLLGQASMVIVSCGQTIAQTATVCDPSTIRWSRWFQKIR